MYHIVILSMDSLLHSTGTSNIFRFLCHSALARQNHCCLVNRARQHHATHCFVVGKCLERAVPICSVAGMGDCFRAIRHDCCTSNCRSAESSIRHGKFLFLSQRRGVSTIDLCQNINNATGGDKSIRSLTVVVHSSSPGNG